MNKDIIEDAAKGDREAFEVIYKEFSGFVFKVAFSITGSIEEASDVTQEVFIKVFKGLSGFEGRSSFKTWIFRITSNTASAGARGSSRRIDTGGDYEAAVRTKAGPEDTERPLRKAESARELKGLLEGLNADQRECLILREVEGLTYAEIAGLLEVNINTVRTRLLRARKALLKARVKL